MTYLHPWRYGLPLGLGWQFSFSVVVPCSRDRFSPWWSMWKKKRNMSGRQSLLPPTRVLFSACFPEVPLEVASIPLPLSPTLMTPSTVSYPGWQGSNSPVSYVNGSLSRSVMRLLTSIVPTSILVPCLCSTHTHFPCSVRFPCWEDQGCLWFHSTGLHHKSLQRSTLTLPGDYTPRYPHRHACWGSQPTSNKVQEISLLSQQLQTSGCTSAHHLGRVVSLMAWQLIV